MRQQTTTMLPSLPGYSLATRPLLRTASQSSVGKPFRNGSRPVPAVAPQKPHQQGGRECLSVRRYGWHASSSLTPRPTPLVHRQRQNQSNRDQTLLPAPAAPEAEQDD